VGQPARAGAGRSRGVFASGDTSTMRARLTSSHLVGRVGELAELELAWREAEARRPVVVLLGGDSGVGKTRLVGEFEQRLSDRDALVLRGESVEQGDTELPYAPLLGALRPLVRERHPTIERLTAGSRAQLSAVLPTLDDAGVPPPGSADGSGQVRLFEALLELLDCLSEIQPVALILEDVHWADRSTRTFVTFLARSLRQERVMTLLTYRSDELHRRHPLRPLLAELERLERARRVDLAPFDRAEMAEALSDILGDRPSHELVERLYERSEGNPLYIEELLAAGLDGRGSAPQSLRDAFMLRIERLAPDAQRAARAIAVGRSLDETTISELTGIEHLRLHEALREAVAEQVLIAHDDGGLLFRHALLREAVYDDLLPGERVELHLALARLLEQRNGTGGEREVQVAATIASHYAAAGDQPAALRAFVRAAIAAHAALAYGEAAEMTERALELWPRLADPEALAGIDRVELLTLAAEAHAHGGENARSEVLLEAALSELDAEANPQRYAALLARLARTLWGLNRGLEGVAMAERALAILGPDPEPTHERATLLAWLARTRDLRGRYRDAVSAAEEALAAALAAGDTRARADALNTLGMAQIALGQVDQGAASLREAIELARRAEDVDGMTYAYANLADLLNLRGRTAEALDVAREGLAVTPRRLPHAYDWMSLTLSELAFELGDWETARAHLGPPRGQMLGVPLIFRLLREADLALGVGDEDLAARCLEEAEPLVALSSEPQWIGVLGSLLGELHRRRRDLGGARAAVAAALDRLEVCTDDVMRIARVTGIGLKIEADFAQRARDLREKSQERDAIARARIHMQRLSAAAAEGGPVETAWQRTGAGELARARGRHDPALWIAAARAWEELARPYPVAMAHWRAAEAAIERSDREAAGEAARDALRSARELGAEWLVAEVSALGERARLELGTTTRVGESSDDADGAGGPAGSTNGAGAEDPFGLTPRERQVLALIAEGATNRQIGAALYMAEKTASVHVSRILSKLGVRSRTQAAAVAHRMHLS
jgi:predicted ATPase/DNA-binding CsgD family transcriptional regulator